MCNRRDEWSGDLAAVCDNAAGGRMSTADFSVRIEIDYQLRLNWSLLRAGIPLLWRVAIENRALTPASLANDSRERPSRDRSATSPFA